MKSVFKTLMMFLTVSVLFASCKKENTDNPTDPTKPSTDPSTEVVEVTTDNLIGNWILVDWKSSKYPDSDMSGIYGYNLSLLKDGKLSGTLLNEGILGIFDKWIYSATTGKLVLTDSTMEYESLVFKVESLASAKLVMSCVNSYDAEHVMTLTFERGK